MFYVYYAYENNRLVYIGEGKEQRYKKIISGVSHCYEANKSHFEGNNLRSEIVYTFNTKQEALKKEKELILELKPKWNTTHKVRAAKTTYRLKTFYGKKCTVWRVIKIDDGKWKTLGRYKTKQEARDLLENLRKG